MKTPGMLMLPLALMGAAMGESAQTDEPVLGRPSAIRPSQIEQETVALEVGARLREQPRIDSPVLEILAASLELPILDRQGSWVKVRLGAWQGWVLGGGEASKTGQELSVSFEPDEARLLRARSFLGVDVEPMPFDPFTLYTDVGDEELLDWLSEVARDVFRAYRERFDLDPGSGGREVLVVFAEEADYRVFEAAEDRVAKADSRGYTSEGLSVLFVGDHPRMSLVSVFIHELTHLLGRRVFRAEMPPWLEEGMAEDLAFSLVTSKGNIRLGTLAGIQRQGLGDRLAPTGPAAQLTALVASWVSPTHLDLDSLLSMSWADFIRPDVRAVHYAASAMLLRYFLDGGDETLRSGFLQYLALVSQAELADSVPLWATLGASREEVEEGCFSFVLAQARAHGIR